jgi:hypothetical protein
MNMLLPPLKPMVQSRRGVAYILEAQMHLLAVAIPKFIQLDMPHYQLNKSWYNLCQWVHWVRLYLQNISYPIP